MSIVFIIFFRFVIIASGTKCNIKGEYQTVHATILNFVYRQYEHKSYHSITALNLSFKRSHSVKINPVQFACYLLMFFELKKNNLKSLLKKNPLFNS